MKTRIHTFNLLIALIVSVLIYGCAHTNNLAQYNISSSKILFKKYVPYDLSKVYVDINTGYGNDTKSIIGVILGEVGSGYAKGQVREKFQSAINEDSISTNIMSGIKEGLLTYYKINPVETLEDNPQYIM